jgi:hypothetical protein
MTRIWLLAGTMLLAAPAIAAPEKDAAAETE